MAEIYGLRWTSSFGEDPDHGAALTWGKGLAGVTPEQLANGLTACLASADPWPPTLPEFRARCLGIPPLAQVQLELRPGAQRGGFTLLVWQCIDAHRLRQASAEKADRLVRDAYELARERVMRGEKMPAAPGPAIANEEPKGACPKRDPEVARAALEELATLLGRNADEVEDAEEEAPVTGKAAAAGPDA